MKTLLALDVETTGETPDEGEICEIAMIQISPKSRRSTKTFSSLCSVGGAMSSVARATHHIDPNELTRYFQASHYIAEHWPNDPVVVAHNAPFDMGFIRPHLESLKIPHPRVICTYQCSRHLWPDSPRHKLQVLRYELGLQVNPPPDLAPHRALYDTIVLAALLKRMLETHSIEKLIELTETPILLKTVGFGKHKGEDWGNVPVDYLHWILRSEFDADTTFTARHWVSEHGQGK